MRCGESKESAVEEESGRRNQQLLTEDREREKEPKKEGSPETHRLTRQNGRLSPGHRALPHTGKRSVAGKATGDASGEAFPGSRTAAATRVVVLTGRAQLWPPALLYKKGDQVDRRQLFTEKHKKKSEEEDAEGWQVGGEKQPKDSAPHRAATQECPSPGANHWAGSKPAGGAGSLWHCSAGAGSAPRQGAPRSPSRRICNPVQAV